MVVVLLDQRRHLSLLPRMRIAFVTSLLPTARLVTGAEMADACIIEALEQAGCEVRLFGFLRDGDHDAPPTDSIVLARRPARSPAASLLRKVGWLRESARLGLPSTAARLAVADSGALRTAMAQDGPFDACVVSGAEVAAAFPWLLVEFPALFVAREVGHLAASERLAGAGLIDGAMLRRDAALLRRFERTAIDAALFVWCLAEEDRGLFGTGIEAKSAVLPLLAPVSAKSGGSEPSIDVGLIGRWTCRTATTGLRWFADRVAPQLPDDISISLAGALPPGMRGMSPRIGLADESSDAGAFITSCRCMALTSRAQTGITAEAVDILQRGMPAVATPASVRGICWLPTNCLVADDPRDFAAALTKLVRDLRSERSVAVDGRMFIETQQRGLRNGIAVGLAALRGAQAAP